MANGTLTERRRAFVSRAFEALNEGDRDGLRGLIPADARFRSVVGALEGTGVYTGPDEFLQLYDSLHSTWDELIWHFDEVRDAGGRSVVLYRITGVAKGSGVPLEQRLAQVWSWRDGEAEPSVVEIYTDQRQAIEAVGLPRG